MSAIRNKKVADLSRLLLLLRQKTVYLLLPREEVGESLRQPRYRENKQAEKKGRNVERNVVCSYACIEEERSCCRPQWQHRLYYGLPLGEEEKTKIMPLKTEPPPKKVAVKKKRRRLESVVYL